MALTATLHHHEISLSDTDRGVYESLDLRIAQHPSETMRYLLTRTLGLCLLWEEGIAFSHGLSTVEEPAVWVREPDGRVKLWIDVGQPSAERLHHASKQASRVAVCTSLDPAALRRSVEGRRIHRAEQIEVVGFETEFLGALEESLGRKARWELVHTGGCLYATVGGKTIEGNVTRGPLVEPE